MSRGLTSGMQSAVAATSVFPAIFASFDFSSGTIYMWSGIGPITWNGQTWSGLGDFLAIDKISEESQISARGVKFTLSGVPSASIAEALVSDYRGRACKVYLGCFDNTGALVTSPLQIFGGLMNQMTISDAGDQCIISMMTESRLIDLQRQRERRYTDADQKFFYPTDTGLQYVAGLQDQTINWGQPNPAPTTPAAQPNVGYAGYGNTRNAA